MQLPMRYKAVFSATITGVTIDGEIELKRDNGTEFAIRFTVKEKSEQAS